MGVVEAGGVVVQHGIVGVYAAVQAELAAVDAGKHAGPVGIFLADVGIRYQLRAIGLRAAHRLNRAGGIAHEGREVQVGALHKGAVAQLVVVGVFGVECRLSLGNDERVGLLRVGVQKLQRGPLNALVVGQLQHVAIGQPAREVGAGHQHTVVGHGHRAQLVLKVGRDGGVLVAQARLQGETFGQAQGVGGVGGGHVLAVVEAVVQARAGFGHERATGPRVLKIAVVAVHAAHNVLGPELQNLGFGDGRLVVGLHREFLVGAGVFVAQARRGRVRAQNIVREIIGAVVAAVQRQNAEFLLRLLEGVGEVQAGIHGLGVVGHAHVAHRAALHRRQRAESELVGVPVAGSVRERSRERVMLIKVVIPAQHRAAKRLALARIGRLQGGRGHTALGIFENLLVAVFARNVVARPPEAAQREAHFAGAVAALHAQVAAAGADAGIHAQGAAAQVVLLGDDVDDAAAALRVVLGRGRGDDFHGLNLVGRNLAQRIGHAGGGNGRGLVVDEHLDVGAAAQAHVAIQVHAQQGHPLEHVGGIAAAGRLVVFGVVHRAVYLFLNQRFLRRHHHFAQLLGRSRQGHFAQIHGLAGGDYHAGPLLVLIPQKAHLHRVGAGRNAGQHKPAVVAAHAPVHHFAGCPIEHGHRGVGHRFVRRRIEHGARDAASGRARSRGEHGATASGGGARLGKSN